MRLGQAATAAWPAATPPMQSCRQLKAAASDAILGADTMQILIVDDNEDARFMMAEYFRAYGHDVLEAGSGEAGLAHLHAAAPRVAILDLGLPDMSGYELATLVRRKLPDIHLVAVSGYATEEDRERALACGFARHFAKPAMMQTILDFLGELQA